MLVSHSHRFIFIHVGKTAGMSIRNTLEPYATEPERFKIRRPARLKDGKPNPLYPMWETLLLHPTARDVRREIPAEIFDGYLKFAFVRNPWDFLVSTYTFMLRDPDIPRHAEVKALGSFDAFLRWAIAEKSPFPKGITKLQSDMLTDEAGNLLVDVIGRYESLNADFAGICQRVGIEAALPHLNRSRHADYRAAYTAETRALVAEHFRQDIDNFNYTFDGLKGRAA
ncbi:MAG: sulfotransferase family 2 domain-containing protein [Paracraurococcus sp.]